MFKRYAVGTLLTAVVLSLYPGSRSGLSYLVTGAVATWLALLLGPRSILERAGAVMAAGLVAWFAGPRPAYKGEGLLAHLFGWLVASFVLSWWLHPRREEA